MRNNGGHAINNTTQRVVILPQRSMQIIFKNESLKPCICIEPLVEVMLMYLFFVFWGFGFWIGAPVACFFSPHLRTLDPGEKSKQRLLHRYFSRPFA